MYDVRECGRHFPQLLVAYTRTVQIQRLSKHSGARFTCQALPW